MTPIEHLLGPCPCVKCGTPLAQGCDCWVTLKCEKCGRQKRAEREPSDPPGTTTIKTPCPECVGGDFALVDYFDKDGRQLLPEQP